MFGFWGKKTKYSFFKEADLETADTLRQAYRQLAIDLHPDKHQGKEKKYTKIFQTMQAEYEAILAGTTEEAYKAAYTSEVKEQALKDMLDAVIQLSGLEVELCGCWLWIGGNTREHKEALKSLGFRWSQKKGLWYWGLTKPRKRKRTMKMNEIRARYGSERVGTKRKFALLG